MSRLEPPDTAPTPDIPGYTPSEVDERPFIVLLLGPGVDAGDVVAPLMGSYPPQSVRALVWVDPEKTGPRDAAIAAILQDLRLSGFFPIEVQRIPDGADIVGVHSFDFPDSASISFLAALAIEHGIEGRRWSQGTCTGIFGGQAP